MFAWIDDKVRISTSDMEVMPMRNINQLKQGYLASAYYLRHLKGTFGSHTGNGWYQWHGLYSFHTDKSAGSLVINKTAGGFQCFSCGAQVDKTEIHEVVKEAAREASKEVLHDLLKYAGYDIKDNPDELLRDLNYLRRTRQVSESITTKARMVLLTIFVSSLASMAWVGFQAIISGK